MGKCFTIQGRRKQFLVGGGGRGTRFYRLDIRINRQAILHAIGIRWVFLRVISKYGKLNVEDYCMYDFGLHK